MRSEHPALPISPPTSTNWQWWDVLHGAEAMVLETLASSCALSCSPSILGCNLRLGLLFRRGWEVGACSSPASISRRTWKPARGPAALYSLLRYVGGDGFARQTVGAMTCGASFVETDTGKNAPVHLDLAEEATFVTISYNL